MLIYPSDMLLLCQECGACDPPLSTSSIEYIFKARKTYISKEWWMIYLSFSPLQPAILHLRPRIVNYLYKTDTTRIQCFQIYFILQWCPGQLATPRLFPQILATSHQHRYRLTLPTKSKVDGKKSPDIFIFVRFEPGSPRFSPLHWPLSHLWLLTSSSSSKYFLYFLYIN